MAPLLLSGVAVAQENQWPYHPTHPKGPSGQAPDPRYSDLTQAQRAAVTRALDALCGLLGCPQLGDAARTILLGEVMCLEMLLADDKIVGWDSRDPNDPDPPDTSGLRTLADSTNAQRDSIFTKESGNVIAADGFKQAGNVQSFGTASTTFGNDAMFGAMLAAELGHQDMHCRMDDNGAFLADPAGTPGGVGHFQMLANSNSSEVEVHSRAIELMNNFLVCPPPLSPLDKKRFQQALGALEKSKKMYGG